MSETVKHTVKNENLEKMFQSLLAIGEMGNLPMNFRFARNIKLLEKPARIHQKGIYDIQMAKSQKLNNGDPVLDHQGNIQYVNRQEVDKLFQELNEKEVEITILPIQTEAYPKEAWVRIPSNMLVPLLDVIVFEEQTGLKLSK